MSIASRKGVAEARPLSLIAILALLVLFVSGLFGCAGEEPRIEVVELDAEEASAQIAEIEADVSVELMDGLELNLWATESLMGDPVAMHVTDHGSVFVTQTRRHRQQEFDIRDRPEWMIPSITWQTVEDRRNFLREELAPERSDENEWLPDHNEDGSRDWRDLKALPETIYRIDDTSGDGLADRSQVFFEGFTTEVSDIAAGVFSYGDDVFVTVAPDLWRLRDTSGDGWADSKESLVHGFSVHIGFSGHGLSGPTMGPDGRLYWAIGDFGFHVEDNEGNTWDYPNEGAVFRSDLDGSNFEVYARGLRNTHEFAFDEYGNLLSVDNDGDHAGEHERVVYLVDGSDSGWRINWQIGKYTDPDNNNYNVWMDEELYKPRFDGQAAYILPPVAAFEAGPSGLAYNPGTALNEDWRGFMFVTEFRGNPPGSRISALRLEEQGAGMELAEREVILSGLQFTSLSFGPDGALYGSDWIEGWGMNDQGRIWTIDTPDAAGSEVREEVKNLLQEDFAERSEEELFELLGHDDMRIRQKAQFELAGRGDAETLLNALDQTDRQLARIHGIWGLGQIHRAGDDVGASLAEFLQDEDPEIRSQVAKIIGDVGYAAAGDELIALLEDESLRTRFFAAEALGRIAHGPAVEPLIDMLIENDDEDAYLRHAGSLALARIGDADAVTALSDHSSRALRIAAVVALRHMQDPGVAAFLQDEDEYIVTEAARAINDDTSIEEALPDLARVLEEDRFTEEPLVRRAINANLRLGNAEDAERVASYAARAGGPEDMRVEALEALGVWPRPSILDRVDGWHRGEVERDPAIARDAMAPVIEELLADGSSSQVRAAAATTAGQLQLEEAAPMLLALVQEDASSDVRIAALGAIHAMEHELTGEAVAAALEDSEQSVRMSALSVAPHVEAAEEPIAEMLAGVVEEGSVEEQQIAIEVLGALGTPEARAQLDRLLDQLLAGQLAPEIQLDVVEAAEADGDTGLVAKVEEYHAAKPGGDAVAAYQEALYGGDVDRGRQVYTQHTGASCQRCHAIDGQGGDVGPDLAGVGDRMSREQLLLSLVDPSANIAHGYGIVTLTLDDGERLTGTLRDETDEYVVMRIGGEDREIEQNEIAERQDAPSSMPAMGPILTRSELRDLVEYLTTLE